jgi:nucleoside-diphosphate-sugar epimerase
MARALIVGCGCRGRGLGQRLVGEGWAVRGTSRGPDALAAIEEAGIEPAVADPDRPGTLLDLVGDVAVVLWLLGSARGEEEQLEAIHGPRLERVLERLVDTPVRGFVYEGSGTAPRALLERGRQAALDASWRWRIPVAVIDSDPADPAAWTAAALDATLGLVMSTQKDA